MAKTVGITAAVGVELVLGNGDGPVQGGVHIPISPQFYGPGLRMLEEEGLRFVEETAPASE